MQERGGKGNYYESNSKLEKTKISNTTDVG